MVRIERLSNKKPGGGERLLVSEARPYKFVGSNGQVTGASNDERRYHQYQVENLTPLEHTLLISVATGMQ